MEDYYSQKQFLCEQINDIVNGLLEQNDVFFHCVCKTKIHSINRDGLKVSFCEDNRDQNEPLVLRYCFKHKLIETYRMVGGCCAGGERDVEIIAVPARVILSKKFGFDWSAVQTSSHATSTTGTKMSLNDILNTFRSTGFISCYDDVKAEEIKVLTTEEKKFLLPPMYHEF